MVKIDHIGIAVRSIDGALKFYTEVLGLAPAGRETLPDRGLVIAFIHVGESKVELLEPMSPESTVAKFLETRGEGIHHVAFAVRDIEEAMRQAEAAGFTLIDKTPRSGAGGVRVAFLHPKSLNGVLVELCEHGEHGK